MKFSTAYYLFLIYATIILKPILPVAEDMLLHCFAEAHHIATVHAVTGKDHLEKELAASGTDDADKTNKADKTEQAAHEIISHTVLPVFNPQFLINPYPFLSNALSNIFIDFINPPPRIIV